MSAAAPGGFALPFSTCTGTRNESSQLIPGWLQRNGWTVTREAGFVDIYAERGPEKLYAEAKAGLPPSGWTWTLCTASFSGG